MVAMKYNLHTTRQLNYQYKIFFFRVLLSAYKAIAESLGHMFVHINRHSYLVSIVHSSGNQESVGGKEKVAEISCMNKYHLILAKLGYQEEHGDIL